jgi:phospholipid-binding lipoprotein MlaA
VIKLLRILFIISLFFVTPALAQVENIQNSTKIAQIDEPEFNFDDDYEGFDADFADKGEIYDPLEGLNRKTFAFNEFVDAKIAEPLARGYRKYVHKNIRESIGNFIQNITAPMTTFNSVAQGDVKNSIHSLSSFVINSTVGIAGLFDVAGANDIKYRPEDLGQTLGKYGVGDGPYLILPFLGPSNLRDAAGLAGDKAIDPLTFNILEVGGSAELISTDASIALTTAELLETREGLIEVIDDVRKNSFDPYATMRSAYTQNREAKINNKK